MSRAPQALLLGSSEDSHVQAVTETLRRSGRVHPVVLDADVLSHSEFDVSPGLGARLKLPGEGAIELQVGQRGWLRRIAPDQWYEGVVHGSRDAAESSAWLALLSAIVRTTEVEWLSDPVAASVAENKLVQYKSASSLGLLVPQTLVASDVGTIAERLDDSFVIKPLGPSEIREGNSAQAFFARVVEAGDPRLSLLAGAPFIAQERIRVDRHIRAVTVGGRAWLASLNAHKDIPLDWRQASVAHRSFQVTRDDDIAANAVRLAQHLGIGFSSQDWVVDSEEVAFFLDLNPGGQWLFLPCADEVTAALARWLEGMRG